MRSGQTANLLGYLSNLGVHYLLVVGYGPKFGIQLIYGLTKSSISLSLGLNKALHVTFQVRFWLWGLRRRLVKSSKLEPRRLQKTLR